MIASTRGLIALVVIAVALLIAVLFGGSGGRTAIDRSLMPGFDADKVTALEVAHAGQPAVRVMREGQGWRWKEPPGEADSAAVSGLLATLRGARWHRRAGKSAAGRSRAVLRVIAADRATELVIGDALPGVAQTWIVRGSDALLVDSWVATALAPAPLALRVRHPLASAAAATVITVTGAGSELRLEGNQLAKPQALWLDPAHVRALQEALAAVEIVALGPQRPAPESLTIALDQSQLRAIGTCEPNRVLVAAISGNGCVERATWTAVETALATFAKPAEQIADQRPLAITPAKLVLADGKELQLGSTPRLPDGDADPDRVAELVTALSSPAEIVAKPTTKPTGSIVATDGAGAQLTIDLYAGVLARRDEPIALRPTPEAWTLINRSSSALRDPTLWREDALTIASITIDGITYTRGVVIGEWTRAPAGKVDPALVDALAETLASVRAQAALATTKIAHRISVTFTPPAGAPTTHKLELARPGPGGCAGRIDGAAVMLPLPLCTAAVTLALQR